MYYLLIYISFLCAMVPDFYYIKILLSNSMMYVQNWIIAFYNFLISNVRTKLNHNNWIIKFYNVLIYSLKIPIEVFMCIYILMLLFHITITCPNFRYRFCCVGVILRNVICILLASISSLSASIRIIIVAKQPIHV